MVCRACGSFPSGSAGQKQPLLLDQPFPLGIGSGVVSASLVHLDCRCPCLTVCGGCHCNRQRGRSSELDERLGCCEGSLLLVPVRVLAYTVCFSLISGLSPLSPNCPCRCAHCQLCAHPNVLLPLLILAAQVCFVSPLTCIARSPLELLTAFQCPCCPTSCGTLLLPTLSCKQT